jgi:sporadic carbohydrate cluster protein (TIGR04323 family)
MNKKLKGYVSSRKIADSIIPQKIQNMLLRNYCRENNYLLALSSTEYSPDNSFLMLEKTINEIDIYHGVIAYSIYQLPNDKNYRNKLLKKIINKNKIFFFILENICVKNLLHLKELNQIINLNNTLSHCIKKI